MKLKGKNHYAAVLNQASCVNPVKVSSETSSLINKYDYSFTIPEICPALQTSNMSTAPGSDGIQTRVLQLCQLEDDVLNLLTSHSILSDNDNTIPDKWKHSIIISIPKKGYTTSLENQRGIAKSCVFAKLTSKLLLACIRDIIKPQLLGVQCGFRAGRSTVEQTMALRSILDMCCVSKCMTTIIFLTHRNTEKYSTTSGVLQGDTLAPFLVITLLDYVLRETKLMVSLLLLVEVHVIPQFKLVLSCMQTTSQSPVTQLNKPKMIFDTSK